MSVLFPSDVLRERRTVIEGSADLLAVRVHLDGEVTRLLAHPLYVPEEKALLSRWGGNCRDDGAELAFDPFTPRGQRCTRCGRVWDTEQSHGWWIGWYQLWLAERVLVMSLLGSLGDNAAGGARAVESLAALVSSYDRWPNADNVLGPSRPFFSTYLESVWLLHLAAATSLLREQGLLPAGLDRELAEHLFRPSAALIADFDEGRSNRQVWNAAALLGAGQVLGDASMARAATHGSSGLLAALTGNVLADGLWYEGENYHWFALRGLLWGAELLRAAGEVDLWRDDGEAGRRLRAACRAPVLTALPDFSYPARRDSKFGVSLRQRRMAEVWELALARSGGGQQAAGGSEFYSSLLAHVYDPAIPEAEDQASDITDVERVASRGGVRRTRLGWKALAWAAPELPPADPVAWRPGSVHLEATGLAIFRRDEGGTYVGLDYGDSGGGHGHPDRLNLTAVGRGVPWLLDFGTGSYVAPSLAWYRATLAHNAPLVDGTSQHPADGACVAYDERGDWGWVCAVLPDGSAYDGATIQRTLVVAPDYVLDVVQLRSESGERQLALPWHGLGEVRTDEDGLTFKGTGGELRVHLSARQPFSVLLQRAPGPPASSPGEVTAELDYPVAITTGDELTLAACLDPFGTVASLECVDERFLVRRRDGKLDVHQPSDEGWLVELERGDPVRLGGLREMPDDGHADAPALGEAPALPPVAPPLRLDRADQFRRAEEPWEGKEGFSAAADVQVLGDDLVVDVSVVAPEPCFRPPDLKDPEWENENPDIHSDGLQLYVETAGGFFGWLMVPEDADQSRVRVAAVKGTDAENEMVTETRWWPLPDGYGVRIVLSLPEPPRDDVGFDLYVNRAAWGRERRTGQLVWSGARGTRLYLAGDRALPGPLPRVKL